MIRNAKAFAPLLASVAAAVAAAAISVALLGAAPAQAQSADQVKADFARAVYLNSAPPRFTTTAHSRMLRAVVVLRIKLGDNDQWQAEVSSATTPTSPR